MTITPETASASIPQAPAPPPNPFENAKSGPERFTGITDKALKNQRAALRPTGRARLGPENSDPERDYVKFDFNPATIVISHTAQVEPSAGWYQRSGGEAQTSDPKASAAGNVALAATSVEEVAKANGITSITLRSLTFDGNSKGKDVAHTCLRLLKWTHFVPVTHTNSTQQAGLPRLKFIWGSQIYLVHLNHVTVTYTRFDRYGTPVRASVDLTLHSIPKIPRPTNPTSGGLAGRRAHLLTGAETLPELATRCYGGPEHWREIAAANRFGDPLRVRPGTRVYLPSAQEDGR